MLRSFEPSTFYGSNRATLDLVRSIRLSRLSSEPVELKPLENGKKKARSRSSSANGLRIQKPKAKTLKLFPGIKHGIRKPKKKLQKEIKERRGLAAKRKCIREAMKEKFDFSRTPYVIPMRKPRVALNHENSQKRKFFKTTTQIEQSKNNDSPVPEFEEINDIEDERFNEINKGVSKIIHYIDWWDDEDCVKSNITKAKADKITNNTQSLSYITPVQIQKQTTPEIKRTFPLKMKSTTVVDSKTISSTVSKENLNDATTPNKSENRTPETPEFYSIFTSPGSGNVLSDLTNRPKKFKNNLIKAASPNDQYQIDAGQKVIGPTECKKCGMVYDIGDPIDEIRHIKYHKNAKDMQFKISKTDNIVGYSGTDHIILIQHSDSKYKLDKVKSILKITEDEIGTGYSFGPYWKTFIYVRNDHVLGSLIAEPNVQAHRAIQSNGIILLSEESYLIKCGINRIWVKSEFRGQKIATTMVNCLRKNFVYGEYLKIDDIAFSVTTADGNEFAKKFTNRDDYFTYSVS